MQSYAKGPLLALIAMTLIILGLTLGPRLIRKEKTVQPKAKPAAVVQNPFDQYFPMAIGSEWEYELTISRDYDAIIYYSVLWPKGDGLYELTTRRIIYGLDKKKDVFNLHYRVKGKVDQEGFVKLTDGRELEVLEDEALVFLKAKQVFLAIDKKDEDKAIAYRIMVFSEQEMKESGSGFAEGITGDGCSQQILFFQREKGIGIGTGPNEDECEELVMSEGVEDGQIHLQRQIKENKSVGYGGPSWLDNAFTEDMWFKKGVGLVKLEQRVDGHTTMTWRLKKFTPGN